MGMWQSGSKDAVGEASHPVFLCPGCVGLHVSMSAREKEKEEFLS